LFAKRVEGALIDGASRALANWRRVGDEAEPRKIFEYCRVVDRPASLRVVILDAQENAPLG